MRRLLMLVLGLFFLNIQPTALVQAQTLNSYKQTNLVSDTPAWLRTPTPTSSIPGASLFLLEPRF